MEGFTYNGIHSDKMKVHYVPDATARGDFFTEFEVQSLDRSWIPGSEYFHTRIIAKKIEIDCYYEQITKAEREKIIKWLDSRKAGELIFDNRPYAAYYVRPNKKIEFKDYLQREMGEELYSGTFTINFTAFDPFAKLIWKTIDGHEDHEWALAETALVKSAHMPKSVETTDTECMIYNPGTETGHSVIRFAGKTGSGNFEIYNASTNTRFVLKPGLELEDDAYYEISSKTGRVERVTGEKREVEFVFHDEGYITFAPAGEIWRDIKISTRAGSKTIKSDLPVFEEAMANKFIWVNDGWKKISYVKSETIITINVPAAEDSEQMTDISDMNVLSISAAGDAAITMLEITCEAEVR